jgi:hypothetical protein
LPGSLILVADDFDEPLPDSFWTGEGHKILDQATSTIQGQILEELYRLGKSDGFTEVCRWVQAVAARAAKPNEGVTRAEHVDGSRRSR